MNILTSSPKIFRNNKKNSFKNLFIILSDFSKNRLTILIIVSLSILGSLSRLVIPIIIGKAIDSTNSKHIDFKLIYSQLIIIFVLVIFTAIFQYVLSKFNGSLSYNLCIHLRELLFSKIQRLRLYTISKYDRGQVLAMFSSDIDNFSDGLIMLGEQFFSGISSIFITIVIMYSVDWKMASIVVFVSPLSLLASKLVAGYSKKFFAKNLIDRSKLGDICEECIEELATIKSLHIEDNRLHYFERINTELKISSLKSMFISSLSNPLSRFVNATIYAVITATAAYFVISDKLSIGIFVAFLAYAQQYSKPFNDISQVLSEFQNALNSANKFANFLKEDEAEYGSYNLDMKNTNNEESSNLVSNSSKSYKKNKQIYQASNFTHLNYTISTEKNKETTLQTLEPLLGALEFKNVYFSYPGQDDFIKNLNFFVPKGSKVGIVGETGSGKSTLINLLLRFYDIKSGDILLDNKSIYTYEINELRKHFAYIAQESFIRRGTIIDNIRLDRDISDETCIEAAIEANADSFIRELNGGYYYFIDNPSSLSEGQKQLLAISRLFAAPSDIVILDEASSSLDSRNENLIKDALNKLMSGKTSFIIAHRLQNILDSDIILMVKDGDIVEIGKHSELMNLNGEYKKLYLSQYSQEAI